MKWNKSSGYVERLSAETTLKNFLGINTLDYYVDKAGENEESLFIPYYTYIMKYLNEKFIILGETDIKLKIKEFERIFINGNEKIAANATLDVVRAVGIETHSEFEDERIHDVVIDEDNIIYNQDRFVFAWTNLMTSLWMRLKFQYANLFIEEYDGDCCKCGAKGQTENDYESWCSGVFPEDELYNRGYYESERSTTAWGLNKSRYCDCYRK